MRHLQTMVPNKLIMTVHAGASLSKAKREAVLVAVEENTIVEFRYNDKFYTVNPRDIFLTIEEEEIYYE